jgi:hypothetical protein
VRPFGRPLALALLALSLAAASGWGDIIRLKQGQVEGVIVEKTPTRLVVETKVGKVVLDPADVVAIEHKSTPLSLYQEMAAKVDAKDAAGHYALGLWCAEQKLFREARQEFEKTVALDPDHKGARERLGYVQKDGQWMIRAGAKQAEGLVLHEGKWVTAAERDAALRRQGALEWQRRVRKAIAAGPMTPDRVAARLAALFSREEAKKEGLTPRRKDAKGQKEKPELALDETAAMALRAVLSEFVKDALDDRRDATSEARVALVETLAGKPSTETNELLRRAAVQDRSEIVRAVALQALADQDSVDNTAYFVGLLHRYSGPRYRVNGSKQTRATARRVLRRAAIALGELADARAIPALANTLYLRFHISEQAGDVPPMTIGFATPRVAGGTVVTDSHGNQMVMPVQEDSNWGLSGPEDKPPVEDAFFFNEAAYAALRKLTSQDFSTDKNAWLAWWYRNKHNLVD